MLLLRSIAYIHEANTRFGRKVVKVELDKKKIEVIFLQQTKLTVYDNVHTNVMAPEPDLSNCNPTKDLVLQKVYGNDAVFKRQAEITLWLALDNVVHAGGTISVLFY